MINKNTDLYISASGSPGNFGATVYNELFKIFGINAVYLPRRFTDASKLIECIKIMNVKGCSVSMPLKNEVVKYLDYIDDVCIITESVNTIVNNGSVLNGYNTDVYGARYVFSLINPERVLIYGSGSVTNSIVFALKGFCNDINITARNKIKAQNIANRFRIEYIENVTERDSKFDLLINTTPASIEKEHKICSLLPYVEKVFDIVVSPKDTELIKKAKENGHDTISGIEMSKAQLKKQFEIYTGIECDIRTINQAIKRYKNNKELFKELVELRWKLET